jgi:hypothetical protein
MRANAIERSTDWFEERNLKLAMREKKYGQVRKKLRIRR